MEFQKDKVKRLDELTQRYLANQLSEEEVLELRTLLHNLPSEQKALRETYNLYSLLLVAPQRGDATQSHRDFRRWKRAQRAKRKKVITAQFLRYAAILVAILLIGYFYGEHRASKELREQLVEITAPAGQRVLFTMSDGSTIHLSPCSKLTYDAAFGRDNRQVTLEGAAFFEVKKMQEHPFRVVTEGEFYVEVLGTEFYLQSDQVAPFHLSLLEGSVAISHNEFAKKPLLIHPGEKVEFTENALKVTEIDLSEISNRRLGIVQYRSATLEEVFADISHWYGVEVIFDGTGLRERTMNGKIRQGDSLKSILEAISSSLYFSYEFITDTTIRITE